MVGSILRENTTNSSPCGRSWCPGGRAPSSPSSATSPKSRRGNISRCICDTSWPTSCSDCLTRNACSTRRKSSYSCVHQVLRSVRYSIDHADVRADASVEAPRHHQSVQDLLWGRFRSNSACKQTAKENDIARINKFVSTLKTMSNYLAALVEKALALAEKYDYYAQMIGRFGFLQRMYEQLSLAEFTNHSRQQTIFIRD